MTIDATLVGIRDVVSIDRPILTPKQEQEKWLAEAIQAVREKSTHVRTYIRQQEFIHVLRNASQMLLELRTGMLAPQYYYELYVKVFDEMQHLEQYFEEEHGRGRSLEEMYEVVQHAGNIVPRLYLLITIGSVCIKSGEQPAIEIFRDLVEMCKGVQHPTRGLFLRHFLLSMMKNKLPGDSGRGIANSAEDDGGTVEDTAELILQNFHEMNWLWIRIEAKAPPRVVEAQSMLQRKQRDRRELCVLVGLNIVRLSQLEGVDLPAYKKMILPRLLSIIAKYREPLTQQYLLEVIVQVFPDEFHLFTLDEILSTIETVSSGVDVCAVLASLMERLGNYATSLREGVAEVGSHKEEKILQKMFEVFKTRLDTMLIASGGVDNSNNNNNNNNNNNVGEEEEVNTRRKKNDSGRASTNSNSKRPLHYFPLPSYVKSMMNLVILTLKTDPEAAVEHIGVVFTSLVEQLEDQPKEAVVRKIERMIVHVITKLRDPSVILGIADLDVLVQKLPFTSRRVVALTLCSTSVQSSLHRINTLDLCAKFFELIASLVQDEADAPAHRHAIYVGDVGVDFHEEQHLVCRVLHLLQSDDNVTQMKMLNSVRKLLAHGGPERTVVTFPTLISRYIHFALAVTKTRAITTMGSEENTTTVADDDGDKHDENVEGGDGAAAASSNVAAKVVSCTKLFRAIHSGDGKGLLEILAAEKPMESFYLYLTSANAADTCALSDVAYEHYVSAFQIYEENAADTREQIEMVSSLISSLCGLRNMPEESYELLATKVCQYSSKLVRKDDQSRLVSACANLFWKNSLSEESHRRVLECLQRSLKIADHVQTAQRLPLFVDLLNQMLHYYAGKAPGVTVKYISTLINLVQEATEGRGSTRGGGREVREPNEDDSDDDINNNNNNRGGGGGGRKSISGDVHSEKEVDAAACTFYRNTTRYIRARQEVDERWKEIDV